EEVLLHHPDVDEVLLVHRGGAEAAIWGRSWADQLRLLRRLRGRRFDLALDLTDGDRAAFLTWASGARLRVGFNREGRLRGRAYHRVVPLLPGRRHAVEADLEALRALGLPVRPVAPSLSVPPEAEAAAEDLLVRRRVSRDRDLVLLHPGARWWFKAWPVERFAALADRIEEELEARVLIAGGAEDATTAEAIRWGMQRPAISVAGETSVLELAAVLKRCRLFVTNDNGPMHIAAAVGTPVVALFGPTDPAEWGPWGDGHVVLYKGVDCRECWRRSACWRGEDNCLRQIPVEEAMNAVRRAWNGKGQNVR
ncbi:MAG TPA: glycosyltransferase family 9 protein, partial [Candidatus Methylomirabilis sp.]|nr:glycosyltransferase family 9 protein [Candidatus Methylomirabilis sp.]